MIVSKNKAKKPSARLQSIKQDVTIQSARRRDKAGVSRRAAYRGSEGNTKGSVGFQPRQPGRPDTSGRPRHFAFEVERFALRTSERESLSVDAFWTDGATGATP